MLPGFMAGFSEELSSFLGPILRLKTEFPQFASGEE